jgi:hypothetical protein
MTPPIRVAVAPTLSTDGGAYGSERRSRGVSSRATAGDGDGLGDAEELGEGDNGNGGGGATTTGSHATTVIRSTMPSQRTENSLTMAMASARVSSPSSPYEFAIDVSGITRGSYLRRLLPDIFVSRDPVKSVRCACSSA